MAKHVRASALTGCLALAGAAVAMVLAGCGASAGPSPQGSANVRALVALRALARCVRAHGLPQFPDPVVGSNGVPNFPDSAPRVPPATQQACRQVAATIPPAYTATAPVSSSQLRALLAFARCMRAHGIPDWPDPNALGQFRIDQRIFRAGKPLIEGTGHACARLNPNPSGGIDVVQPG